MKNIYDTLNLMGVKLPMWVLLLILIVLILCGLILLWKKHIKPYFKRMFKLQDDLESIEEIQNKLAEEVDRSKEADDEIDKRITALDGKLDLMIESLSRLQQFNAEQEEENNAQKETLKMLMCNELDKRYRRYLELGYVPQDEYDEYVDMHDSYKGIGGNHSGDLKFQYVMDNLQVK